LACLYLFRNKLGFILAWLFYFEIGLALFLWPGGGANKDLLRAQTCFGLCMLTHGRVTPTWPSFYYPLTNISIGHKHPTKMQLTEREEKKLFRLDYLRREATCKGNEFAWYDLEYELCSFSGGKLGERPVIDEKALIGINDVFHFMRESMSEGEKKMFVKKVLAALNGEPAVWGSLLPIVKENCLRHRDPMKWLGNGEPFSLPRKRKELPKDVSTQTDVNKDLPIYPILVISATVLIVVYFYAKL
jgi:hypothetical protein